MRLNQADDSLIPGERKRIMHLREKNLKEMRKRHRNTGVMPV